MQTSCYNLYKGPLAVSIARRSPDYYAGREYKILAPKYWLFKKYKEDHDKDFYTIEYFKMLNNLNPRKVFEDLGANSILLCWELPGKFCHRRLVAKWLEDSLGIEVPELEV